MKTFVLLLVGWVALASGTALADDTGTSPLKVTVAIPEIIPSNLDGDTHRSLNDQDPDAYFDVVIQNVSSSPILIMQGEPGMTDQLTIEVTEEDGKTTSIKEEDWVGSHRLYSIRLAPGESMVLPVDYVPPDVYFAARKYSKPSGFLWSGDFPFQRSREKTVTLRAIYEWNDANTVEEPGASPTLHNKAVSPDYTVVLIGG